MPARADEKSVGRTRRVSPPQGRGESEDAGQPGIVGFVSPFERPPSSIERCTLGLVVPDDEFVTMVADANRLRAAVKELGYRGSDIDSNVRARLYWNPKIPNLPEGQKRLADEVHALLDNSRLSATQAAQLEREYFPPRGHP